jgi:hypothetical protein
VPGRHPDCRPQDPVPDGEVCGKDLDYWFTDAILYPKPSPIPSKPKPPLTMADLPPAVVKCWRPSNCRLLPFLITRAVALLEPQHRLLAAMTARTAQAYDFSASLSARCFLRDTVLADRVNGAPRFHAIKLRVDAPYLFYNPVNDRAGGERPHSKNDNGRHGWPFSYSAVPRWSFAGPTLGHTPKQA